MFLVIGNLQAKPLSDDEAMIFADTKGVHLIDLGSSCGTFLEDGTRLEAGKEYFLISGSRFYIGSRKNFFTVWF